MKRFEDRSYFFDEGILFECRRCGTCCTGSPGTVYVNKPEISDISRFLCISDQSFTSRYAYAYKDAYSLREKPDGECVFFQGKCIIYPVRPLQCRTFPFWFINLRSEAAWRNMGKACPGIGKGAWFSKERILLIHHAVFVIC